MGVGDMKRIDITAYGAPEEVAHCVDVPDVGEPGPDEVVFDILVNNAGAPQGADRNEIEDVPVEAWDRTMGVNARGAFLMSRAAVPAMRKADWGRIVSVSSKAAFRPGKHRRLCGLEGGDRRVHKVARL